MNTTFHGTRRQWLGAFGGLGLGLLLGRSVQAATWPSDSVYHLDATLTDQDGRALALADGQGHPVLATMFYTSCQFTCPMIVEAVRHTESQLTPEERAKLTVLMISIDPAHDTVAVLKQTAQQRQLDSPHWTLARADAAAVRKIAAVLGFQYRALAGGEFNHTTALVLLDAQGRIAGRTSQLGRADPGFVKRIKAAVGAPAA